MIIMFILSKSETVFYIPCGATDRCIAASRGSILIPHFLVQIRLLLFKWKRKKDRINSGLWKCCHRENGLLVVVLTKRNHKYICPHVKVSLLWCGMKGTVIGQVIYALMIWVGRSNHGAALWRNLVRKVLYKTRCCDFSVVIWSESCNITQVTYAWIFCADHKWSYSVVILCENSIMEAGIFMHLWTGNLIWKNFGVNFFQRDFKEIYYVLSIQRRARGLCLIRCPV